jgi:uncharacterized membrane protein SpoIIM required for sporulation
MFEALFFELEKKNNFLKVFFLVFFLSLILGVINYYIGGNFLFLIAFVSLYLSFPMVDYLRGRIIFEEKNDKTLWSLFTDYYIDINIVWYIFISCFFAFFILLNLGYIIEFSYIGDAVTKIAGNMTETESFFLYILKNNLYVALFTFLISLIGISGFVFTLVLNAGILSYFIFSKTNEILIFLYFLPHCLLEIGGFFLAGLAGVILSMKLSSVISSNKTSMSLEGSVRDCLFSLFLSVLLIFLGALVEVYL